MFERRLALILQFLKECEYLIGKVTESQWGGTDEAQGRGSLHAPLQV